jgi:hypothetical protein
MITRSFCRTRRRNNNYLVMVRFIKKFEPTAVGKFAFEHSLLVFVINEYKIVLPY